VDYLVDDHMQITGMKLVRTRLEDSDASGRRRPVPVENSEWVLPVDRVIEAIGNKAETDSPSWYPNVHTDDRNLIQTDPDTALTTVEGIFAGGDIVRGPALVVTAVKDGKIAARAILDFLHS
jgi:glutamate synthase (NADPH/NADH) small chain